MKKVLLIGGGIISVLVCLCIAVTVIAGLAGSGQQNKAQQDTQAAKTGTTNAEQPEVKAQPTEKPAPATAKLPGLNEPAQSKNFKFTVTKVERAESLGSFSPKKAQGVFIILTTKLDNISNQSQIINSWDLTLYDSQNRKYQLSSEGGTALGLSGTEPSAFWLNATIQPSLSKTVLLVFDIVPDAKGLQLEVQDRKRIALD